MDNSDLKQAGETFKVGEDLYGVSLAQLKERTDILRAEIKRIEEEINKKDAELNAAEDFFKKS